MTEQAVLEPAAEPAAPQSAEQPPASPPAEPVHLALPEDFSIDLSFVENWINSAPAPEFGELPKIPSGRFSATDGSYEILFTPSGEWKEWFYINGGLLKSRSSKGTWEDRHVNAEKNLELVRSGDAENITKWVVAQTDSNKRLTASLSSTGQWTEQRFEDKLRYSTVKNSLGESTFTRYDEIGRVISVRHASGEDSNMVYNTRGVVELLIESNRVWKLVAAAPGASPKFLYRCEATEDYKLYENGRMVSLIDYTGEQLYNSADEDGDAGAEITEVNTNVPSLG